VLGERGEQRVGIGEHAGVGAAGVVAERQIAVEDRDAAVAIGARHGQSLEEVRAGVPARVPVADLAIDRRHLLEREVVDVVPGVAEPDLVEVAAVLEHDAARFVRRRLLDVEHEPDRAGQRRAADAGVGEPAGAVDLDAQEHVGARRDEVARPLDANPRRERHRVEAEREEHVQEVAVLLEAVTAAARVHQLVLDRGRIEIDAAPEQDVEVLERDARHVRARERVQGLQRRRARTGVADAREVRVEIRGERLGAHRLFAAATSAS
jgi:hypothetical protein